MSKPTRYLPNSFWTRRRILTSGALALVGHRATAALGAQPTMSRFIGRERHCKFRGRPAVRIGLLTDVHHAEKEPKGLHHFPDSLGKLSEAADEFRAQKVDFVVQLGDIIDGGQSKDVEASMLANAWGTLRRSGRECHAVLGNHCLESLTKSEHLSITGSPALYYSFDHGGFHFVVLDANNNRDGSDYENANFHWRDPGIPTSQRQWLAADLAATKLPAFVFCHQRIDVGGAHPFGIRNARGVRRILSESGKVAAVFQGHSHFNCQRTLGGVHYSTLLAMIKGAGRRNSGYGILEIFPGGDSRLLGFRKQRSYLLPARFS